MHMAPGASRSAEAVDTSAVRRARRQAIFEITTGYLLILVVIWTPRPWQARLYMMAAAFIVYATWRSWPGTRALGWTSRNLVRASSILLVVAVIAVASACFAKQLGTLHAPPSPRQFVYRFLGYIIFAGVQQFLLQDYFLLRLLRAGLKPKSAAITAAGIFALAHLPNPILTALTFVWGLTATLWFLRYRSLYAIAISHMILGITLAITVPGPIVRNMRVGLGYLSYRPPGSVHLSH